MTLEFELRPSYGRDRFYPVNAAAKRLAVLAKRTSFDREELKSLETDGFAVQLINPQPQPARKV